MYYEIKESGGDLRLYQDGKDVGRATDYPVAVQFWRENVKLRKRETILVDAMAEVKASDEGNDSAQPISRIVAGCIRELQSLK